MDDKIRKSCPNCCQLYHIKHQSSGLKGNLPLLLSCGHTICENCVRSLTKFQEPIECKICLRSIEIKAADILILAQDKSNLYQMFPVNFQVLGELTMQLMNVSNNAAEPVEECFIDIQGIMMDEGITHVECVECHNRTTKMCKQCDTALCETCFNKTHKNFVIFKNHALQKIVSAPDSRNNCKVHDDKQLDYYCNDCSKAVCMDCLLVGSDKSCKEHNLKSTSEVNDTLMEALINLQPKVDETFRRLSKTAVDIGQLLYNIDNGIGIPSEVTQIIIAIEQHFSKLCAIVQNHKKETIELATKIKSAEKESLLKAKKDVFNALKKAKAVMRMISATADTTQFKQMNLSELLDDAKKVAETPWYLLKEENKTNALKMNVNEEINTLISDYIHLEGNTTSVYKLCSPGDLKGVDIPPPPPIPVYPPQLPRDVRQIQNPKAPPPPQPKYKEESSKPFNFFKNAPSYRSKSTSNNSLNSGSSNSSKQSFKPEDMYQSVPRIQPYTPGVEPRPPLVEGSQELVYMSHIVNPHNFFVQRASDQKLVKDILREYRNSVSEPKPLLGNIAEGKIYLAFSKVDNLWQRCRVLSIEKKDIKQPRFIVYCFDFGSIETVSINNLRLLPPGKWHTPPPLAIHCSLANCEPINGEWMNDDSILIQNILDNKQALIHVRRFTETEGGTKLNCDVITCEQKISLAHALVFHDRAKMPNPKLKYPIINTIRETPKIFTSNSDFKPKSIDDIYFTHIVSPDKFFVRKRQHQQDYYRLSEELNQEYSLGLDCGKIFLPELGMACVVNTEKNRIAAESNPRLGEDCTWARCVVTEMAMRGRVRVQLVDSGMILLVHWTSLRAIQSKFTTLRALATECHLAGVTPHNKKWSPASVALLMKYQNHVLEMEVEENRLRGSIGVCLYDKTDEENIVCINDEMVKYKFAITFGMFNFTRNTENLKDQSYTYKSPLDKPTQQPKPDKIKILKRDDPVPQETKENDLVAKDKGPLRLEAKILNYISPSIIYLILVHQQKMFNEMFENIQKYYNENKTEGKTEWHVSEKCCTICIQSQTWRRATVLELDGANAKVFYLDFATVETVQTSGLKVLAPEFASIGVAALKCHLCGVMPAIGDEWPSITKEFLKELLDAYNRVFITKLGNFKDNSMPIEIWVYHTIQGGALEPDKSEWRCLNKKIIEQGLGIPIKSEQLDFDQNDEKKYDKEGEEVLSFLNITGLVSEWLQLPMPTKPLLAKPETDDCGSGSSTVIECEDAYENDVVDLRNANRIFISEWLPAEPLLTKEFTACATFIDNDGIIYLHDVAQNDTFDLIRNALNVRYRDPDPKANYVKWTIGEPCIALYHYDNNFYRGKVMEVNQITSNCLVHYIDFGNEEVCSFANMRKSIALHQIPIQAHKCVFSRIKPIGVQWEKHTLDYIHKLIVEKRCFVKVVGETLDGITPIDMKYDKLWINDHLVDFELAKYIDGARNPNRKVGKINPMTISEKESVKIVSNVETDSGPDFIVEDEDPDLIEVQDESKSNTSFAEDDSFDFSAFKGKDWNTLVAEDIDNTSLTGKYITYPKQSDDEFECDITAIYDTKVFPLTIIHDEETNAIYEELFNKVQEKGDNMPPLNGIFKNKACIALYEEDKQWYRAMILEYSEAKNRIKVMYVDYDNVELVSLSDVRETIEEWVNLPPRTVFAKLHGVDVNPAIDINMIRKEFSEVLLNKGPFHAKIINSAEIIPSVELKDANNDIVSEKLVEKAVFVKDSL